jgi:hypothetical protein
VKYRRADPKIPESLLEGTPGAVMAPPVANYNLTFWWIQWINESENNYFILGINVGSPHAACPQTCTGREHCAEQQWKQANGTCISRLQAPGSRCQQEYTHRTAPQNGAQASVQQRELQRGP